MLRDLETQRLFRNEPLDEARLNGAPIVARADFEKDGARAIGRGGRLFAVTAKVDRNHHETARAWPCEACKRRGNLGHEGGIALGNRPWCQ